MKILVTGANGQLGQCLRKLANTHDFEIVFAKATQLDITQRGQVLENFTKNNYSHCINCAAYTQVDKAETEPVKAQLINVDGAKNLALASKETATVLIHISTDFVFDGRSKTPYTETMATHPLGVYGRTKRDGELAIAQTLTEHFILRTSWLYSQYGNNFMKTMLRLGKEREELSVVNDQLGTPTYAMDLATFILQLVDKKSKAYGIYHYSNGGEATWYGFAKEIFEISRCGIKLRPISTDAYPTPAERPKYSILDKTKAKNTFGLEIPHWKESLKKALTEYRQG